MTDRFWKYTVAALLAIGIGACEADVQEEGELPEVQVEEGQLPEGEIRGPDVEVREDTITVPDVDIREP